MRRAFFACAAFALLPACGAPASTPAPAPQGSELYAAPQVGANGAYVYQMPASGTFTGVLSFPGSTAALGNGTAVTLVSTAFDPTTASTARRPRSVAMNVPYDYFSMTWSANVTTPSELDFTVTPPNGAPAAGTQYYEEYDDTATATGWQVDFAGPFTSDGSTVTYHFPAGPHQAGHAYVMAAYTHVAPTPAGPIAVSPSSVSLLGTGASYAQSVTATEPGYTGSFTSTGTACASVATVSGSGSTLTVTGVAPGSCTATIADAFGQTASLAITVTTSGLSVN